jgi:putative endonuclease
MFYVYVLKSYKDGSFYIGYTEDLKKRVKEHQEGRSKATKFRKPYKLIYYEAFLNIKDAKRRELYLKSGWGWRSLRKMLKNFLAT